MDTNELKMEFVSKWYKFYIYDDYFECFYKCNFFKRNKVVFYKDIISITDYTLTINGIPCRSYKFVVNGQKNFEIPAGFGKQKAELDEAITWVQVYRLNFLENRKFKV